MKILVLGGTRFIGRAVVEELHAGGHEVALIHRGEREPPGLADARHIHCSRADIASVRNQIDEFRAEAFLDTSAYSKASTQPVLPVVRDIPKKIVFSSMDVYRAYGALNSKGVSDPVPIDEESPVRPERYPYRGRIQGMDDYEKLDVEELYLADEAIVMRLAMIYGPFDYQRREEFILSRVRAGRTQIPFGAGNWLTTRCLVGDVASAVRAVIESPDSSGIYNVGESQTLSIRSYAEAILAAAGSDASLIPVPETSLPEDLEHSRAIPQHLLISSNRLRFELGWQDSELEESIGRSVEWHLANPPVEPRTDFSPDDAALRQIG